MNYKTIIVCMILLFSLIGIAGAVDLAPRTPQFTDMYNTLPNVPDNVKVPYSAPAAPEPAPAPKQVDIGTLHNTYPTIKSFYTPLPTPAKIPLASTPLPTATPEPVKVQAVQDVIITPTLTPQATQQPTPSLITEPSPKLKEMIAKKEGIAPQPKLKMATPEPTETPIKQPVLWGTINLSTEPQNASVYIDHKLIGFTPIVKDFSPGYVNIIIEKSGYNNFTKRQVLNDQDYVNLNINLSKTIPSEIINTSSNSSQEQLSFSGAPFAPYDTKNDTVADTTTTRNDNETTWAYVAVAMSGLVAVGVLLVMKGKQEKAMSDYVATQDDKENDMTTSKKIANLIEENREISYAELAEKTGVSTRTVERVMKKLKEENKL